MKINFISYLDPFVHSGGGEQITRTLLEEGKRRGHVINCVHISPLCNNYDENVDLNILWDVYNCPERKTPFNEDWITAVINSSVPHIYGTGGYEDLCALGTLPCLAAIDAYGTKCTVTRDHPTFGPGGVKRSYPVNCSAKRHAHLLTEAQLCIFFSKQHRDLTEQIVGPLNALVAMPPITGLERFTNRKLKRSFDVVSYGGHMEYKGFFNIMREFFNRDVTFIGDGPSDLPRLHGFGSHAGKIAFEAMPTLLNLTKTFVHMPRWPEPFGMTTLQAALCGCEVIENENSNVLKGWDLPDLVEETKRWVNCEPIWEGIEKYAL